MVDMSNVVNEFREAKHLKSLVLQLRSELTAISVGDVSVDQAKLFNLCDQCSATVAQIKLGLKKFDEKKP